LKLIIYIYISLKLGFKTENNIPNLNQSMFAKLVL
jgi:hypothetical protein